MKNRHRGNYNKLAKFLEENGYTVVKEFEPKETYKRRYGYPAFKMNEYTCWQVTGKGIRACFCTPNNSTYTSLDGRFTAENEKCFDKWSKAPLSMIIKTLDKEKLLKELELLGSEEGYKISDSYDYSDGKPFTYDKKE